MATDTTDLTAACRAALRIPDDCTVYDDEIADLISAARAALVAGGVDSGIAESSDDASVRVAIKVYVKANFGMDNPDAERLMRSFAEMLCRMAGSNAHNAPRSDGGAK